MSYQAKPPELIKPPVGKQTHAHYFHRICLAHQIEFQYWTGLRRKEIANLKFSQFDASQQAFINERLCDEVRKRDKTDYNAELEKIFEAFKTV